MNTSLPSRGRVAPLLALALTLTLTVSRLDSAGAALNLSYTNPGADGAFTPSGPTNVVDLSLAVPGNWDDHPGPNAGRGIYDAARWAVVFKFSSINIPAGTTVRFINHPSHAPVVWLVDGDVTIAGQVDLNGGDQDTDPDRIRFPEPGPGGFRGGDAKVAGAATTSGFGPGGSAGYNPGRQFPSFGTAGTVHEEMTPVPTYGNPKLIPLIGGSGNGGSTYSTIDGGGAGGGAILIVTRSQFNLTASGLIQANGGVDTYAGGSGGAIRIVCDSATGNGRLQALGAGTTVNIAGNGRIRLEAQSYAASFGIQPPAFPETPSSPVELWPDSAAPSVRIVSVNGLATPADPRASLTPAAPADLRLAPGSQTNVVTIETVNVPSNAIVTLRVVSTPQGGDVRTNATLVQTISPSVLRWQQTVVINPGYHALQVVTRAP